MMDKEIIYKNNVGIILDWVTVQTPAQVIRTFALVYIDGKKEVFWSPFDMKLSKKTWSLASFHYDGSTKDWVDSFVDNLGKKYIIVDENENYE